MTWFTRIIGWIAGGGLKGITGELRAAYEAKLQAQNDAERLLADQRIALLEAQQTVLVKEADSKLTSWIRPAFAAVFLVYLAKVVVYDKVLGLGVTDPLSPILEETMMVILGAYFLTRPFEKLFKR